VGEWAQHTKTRQNVKRMGHYRSLNNSEEYTTIHQPTEHKNKFIREWFWLYSHQIPFPLLAANVSIQFPIPPYSYYYPVFVVRLSNSNSIHMHPPTVFCLCVMFDDDFVRGQIFIAGWPQPTSYNFFLAVLCPFPSYFVPPIGPSRSTRGGPTIPSSIIIFGQQNSCRVRFLHRFFHPSFLPFLSSRFLQYWREKIKEEKRKKK
jgi:hypothetical protein